MKKLQVLFPEGTMRRLREVAELEDRPMSELVRRATEDWLDSRPPGPAWEGPVPVYRLGIRVSDPEALRELSYVREEEP